MQKNRGFLYVLGLIVDIIFMIPTFFISGAAFALSGIISIAVSVFALISYVLGYAPSWLFPYNTPDIIIVNGEPVLNEIHPVLACFAALGIGVILIVLGIACITLRQWYRRCYARGNEHSNTCPCRHY